MKLRMQMLKHCFRKIKKVRIKSSKLPKELRKPKECMIAILIHKFWVELASLEGWFKGEQGFPH